MKTLIGAVIVSAIILLAASFTANREPTAAECCIEPDIPQTCVKRLYRAENGQLVPADSCEKYLPK